MQEKQMTNEKNLGSPSNGILNSISDEIDIPNEFKTDNVTPVSIHNIETPISELNNQAIQEIKMINDSPENIQESNDNFVPEDIKIQETNDNKENDNNVPEDKIILVTHKSNEHGNIVPEEAEIQENDSTDIVKNLASSKEFDSQDIFMKENIIESTSRKESETPINNIEQDLKNDKLTNGEISPKSIKVVDQEIVPQIQENKIESNKGENKVDIDEIRLICEEDSIFNEPECSDGSSVKHEEITETQNIKEHQNFKEFCPNIN